MVDGKSEFYQKAEQSFISQGYVYYDGDRDISGKGAHHAHKPDYIATKNGIVVIGEIKSPREGPKSSSWRISQHSDGEEFKSVRLEVAQKESQGKIAPEIGGHEIIIRGQIPDYVRVIGIDYDLPFSSSDQSQIMLGYTVPISEAGNVESALKRCGKSVFEKIIDGNGSVTYIFNHQDPFHLKSSSLTSKEHSVAYYYNLKKYEGLFRKKFLKNLHMLFLPSLGDKYLYFIVKGESLDEDDLIFCHLLVEIEKDLLEPLIEGERKELGPNFVFVEAVPCEVSNIADGYFLKVNKVGKYIKSDLSLHLVKDPPEPSEVLYALKGNLILKTKE